jgi:hypothetical protein
VTFVIAHAQTHLRGPPGRDFASSEKYKNEMHEEADQLESEQFKQQSTVITKLQTLSLKQN